MTGTRIYGPSIFFLILLMQTSIFSADIETGGIRLELDEKSGSFSLSSLENGKNSAIPLIYPEDPRTSYFSIVVDNRIYNLRSGSDFRREYIQEADRHIIRWTSRQLEINQEFRIIPAVSSDADDGLAVRFRIRNTSSRKLSIGLRYIIDTYLGEQKGPHFLRSDNRSINGETELVAPYPQYILSPGNGSQDTGLMVMLRAPGLTSPDSVVCANWKRLNESSWSYTVNPSRSFSHPPYSINDSALALYYNPVQLQAEEERLISLAFGPYVPGGYAPDSQISVDALADRIPSDDPTGDPEHEVVLVRDLLSQIDQLMDNGEDVPEEKLRLLRQLLENLKKRRADFED